MKKFTYKIKDEVGIHARPAGYLAKKSKEFENSLQEYHDDIYVLKDSFRKKCEDLTAWFAEKVNVFARESDIVGKKYREEIKLLEADNFNLREKMQAENSRYIQSLNEQFKEIEKQIPEINEKIRVNSEYISSESTYKSFSHSIFYF